MSKTKKQGSRTKRESTPLPKPALGAPRKSRLPYFLLLVALLGSGYMLTTYFLNASDIPLVIGPNTTILVEPLTADGVRVDYFAALNERLEPHVPPEENGFRKLLDAFRERTFESRPPEWYLNALYAKLKLDHAGVKPLPFEPLDLLLAKTFPKDRLPAENDFPPIQKRLQTKRKITGEAWTVEEFPFMRDWLTTNDAVIDVIAESARMEVFYVPKLRERERDSLSIVLNENPRLTARTLIDMLLARAFFRMKETGEAGENERKENTDGAIDDMVAVCRLGVHLSNTPWGYERDPYLAVAALEKAVELLRPRVLDREQLRRFAHEIDRLPRDPFQPEDVLFVSECEALDLVGGLSNGTFSRSHTLVMELLPKQAEGNGIDWNIVAQQVHRVFIEARQLLDEPDPAKRRTMLEFPAVHERGREMGESWYLPTRAKRSRQVGDRLAIRTVFSPKIFRMFEESLGTRRDLLRLAIALEIYRLDKGEYPASLDLLEPAYIPVVPTDPNTLREPFRYVLETAPNESFKAGAEPDRASPPGYLLYSVSADHVDDGGYTQQELMKKPPCGDQRIRMPHDDLFLKIRENAPQNDSQNEPQPALAGE